MKALSRRSFLGRGSVVAAAAGLGAMAPATVGALLSDAPVLGDASQEAPAVGNVEGAVVAHISDASTGQLSIFNGTREVVIKDPTVVSRLLRALH
jgi:hypothetical protein